MSNACHRCAGRIPTVIMGPSELSRLRLASISDADMQCVIASARLVAAVCIGCMTDAEWVNLKKAAVCIGCMTDAEWANLKKAAVLVQRLTVLESQ